MFRTFAWLTWFMFYLIGRLPNYWKAKRLGKQGKFEEKKQLVSDQVSIWSKKILKNIGVELVIEGKENIPKNGEARLYVANHQSYLDIPVLFASLNEAHALLAKGELAKVPLLRGWLKMLGCLLVQREDLRSSMEALRKGEELLKSGQSLVIYPEGTRSKSDEMGEFKQGAVRMAFKAKVPVVPVAIDGSWRALEGNGYKLKKCKIRVIILPEVSVENVDRQEQKNFAKKLENMIKQAKNSNR